MPRSVIREKTETPKLGMLQWASGVGKYRDGRGRVQSLVGFHSEKGRDSVLDLACTNLGIEERLVLHQREGGSETKPHWYFGESLYVIPVTNGPQFETIIANVQEADAVARENGIFVAWPQGDREVSRLAFWCIIAGRTEETATEFLDQGAPLVKFGVKSTLTDHLLAALVAHTRMLEWADNNIDRTKHPKPLEYWELMLPLVGGDEYLAGKTATTTVVAVKAGHPAECDKRYIRSVWVPADIANTAASLFPTVVNYAQSARAALANPFTRVEVE